ncbi:MAG: alanine--tRNA ligase [Erysipelotrichia bacterium]|nr:alanine--tRNA ligase [Erysipelotrichia bacterium]NCC54986.1 alanine--tRNA ligase [Erysipelotrichia bacterium]
MKQRTGNEIRQLFLDYFASKGHMIEPGASLVPHNDPTLLWINAGVAALKKYFDGSEKPKCNRITNAQKSIRTNDIENVGKTARHHTFFEMLGNFSIGDYFKEEAIPFAWEFLTSEQWIGFPKEKLYVSVYTDDEEAYRIWTEVCHVDPSHILKTHDNFWEIGEGPGGPDSEIFYDRGEAYDPQGLGEKLFFEEIENDRYIEVWNVVFSQYDCKPELDRKEYKELPQKNIDTGMGLERLVSLVQGGETNFDTDLFLPIIHACEKMAKYSYEGEYKMAYRVIADHIRTVTFALSDGALFSNNGRGYVLRRVLRRAVRYGIKLGINEPFMYRLVRIVSENMKDYYPYLMDKIAYNENLIKMEEETFHKTLKNGEALLNEEMAKANNHILSGSVVFKLYDTYGFPYELTAEIADENGLSVDEEGFKAEMQKQKDRARAARENVESMASQSEDLMNFTKPSSFIGYDTLTTKAVVIGLFKDGKQVDCLSEEGSVIFDTTSFYAESGGQVSDTGVMIKDGVEVAIVDVKKAPHGQFLHLVELNGESLKVNDEVILKVDVARRNRITANHSATHLLQSALKQVVGDHIAQAGSFNSDEYLRFDFTHFEKVSDEQLTKIESIVNHYIQDKLTVTKELMNIEEAKKSGATALFDEKYGDVVRVVSMGEVSKEFCGGCHVNNTNEIGMLKIVSEESIGSGIRRITAKTGYAAYEEFKAEENTLKAVAAILKMKSCSGVDEKVALLNSEMAELKKQLAKLEEAALMAQADHIVKEAVLIDGKNILIKEMNELNGGALKEMAISLRDKMDRGVVFLSSMNQEKVVFVAAADKQLVKEGIHCGQLVKEAATICDGNGGGKPELAQAGGKASEKVQEAMAKIATNLGLSL